jgi:hypothetical protein
MENIFPWLDAFRTRVFGTMQDQKQIRQLDAVSAELESLNSGSQFTLQEGDHWLRFLLPSID